MVQQEEQNYFPHPILNEILAKVTALEEKFSHFQPVVQTEGSEWMNVTQLIEYLPTHPAEQTVYGWTSAHKIPFHKMGKCIVFKKSEIDEFLESKNLGRKSDKDIEEEAEAYVKNKSRYSRNI